MHPDHTSIASARRSAKDLGVKTMRHAIMHDIIRDRQEIESCRKAASGIANPAMRAKWLAAAIRDPRDRIASNRSFLADLD